jgi:hypothetical protein
MDITANSHKGELFTAVHDVPRPLRLLNFRFTWLGRRCHLLSLVLVSVAIAYLCVQSILLILLLVEIYCLRTVLGGVVV